MVQEEEDESAPIWAKRRCASDGPQHRLISQSQMMQEMYERTSGYDYRFEIESNVTRCSFGSYKEACAQNPDLQLY